MNPLLDKATEPGFHNIGRNPHDCSIDELKAGGFTPHSSTKAIRLMCIACTGNAIKTISECGSIECPLWPWRMGTRPKAWKGLSTGTNSPKNPEKNAIFASENDDR